MFSAKHNQNSSHPLRGRSGQAVVEYILLMVVSVGLITVLALRLIGPFRDWARNYLGAYVECLLDAGELPTLSGEVEGSACEEGFEKFSYADGRPPVSSSPLSPPRGSQLPPYNPSDARAPQTNLGPQGQSRGAGADGASKDQKKENVGEVLPGSPFYAGGSSSTQPAAQGRTQVLSTEQLTEAERRRLPRRGSSNTTVGQIDSSRAARKGLVIPPRERKPSSMDTDVEPWSFGRIFRIAFIVAILAVLFLLIALQARQIQKSLEKGSN